MSTASFLITKKKKGGSENKFKKWTIVYQIFKIKFLFASQPKKLTVHNLNIIYLVKFEQCLPFQKILFFETNQ